ncbi:MAG: SUMF1/EgtB/PvdO family nonheme iron enzyme [Burkholderiaceae bacterium]
MNPRRSKLASLLEQARQTSDRLLAAVRPGAEYERPIAARHRIVFYIGHLDAFDWNLIGAAGLGCPAVDPVFDNLFARGIDPPPGQLPQDRPSDWPRLDEVRRYVRHARTQVDAVLPHADEERVHFAIEHRLMHLETFAYLLHQLSPRDKIALEQAPEPARLPQARRRIEVPAGRVRLGREHGNAFGWDNEFGALEVELPTFAIDSHKVSNGDWLQHVRDGGAVPPFWIAAPGSATGWRLATLFGEIDLPLAWPAWVTQAQASAYAASRGLSLPSEAQWARAAYGTPAGEERRQPWGDADARPEHGNFGLRRFDPVAVDAHPAGTSAFGLAQMVGNGWEWTSTAFGPLPGFAPHPAYPGYSADFFDGAHVVLKGAAPLTHTQLVRRGFRNWFRPDYPFVHAGFRCVATH